MEMNCRLLFSHSLPMSSALLSSTLLTDSRLGLPLHRLLWERSSKFMSKDSATALFSVQRIMTFVYHTY